MKVNIYKAEEPGAYVLEVSGIETDVTEALLNFLQQVEGIEGLTAKDINQIQFCFDARLADPEKQKEVKLSIVTVVRKFLDQDEDQLKSSYMITQQQLETIEKSFRQIQEQAISLGIEVAIHKRVIEKMQQLIGVAMILTGMALLVAAIAIISRLF